TPRRRAGTTAAVDALGVDPFSKRSAGGAGAARHAAREGHAFSLAVGVFVVVGAVVAARRPRNPIGWILLAEGLLWQAMPVLAGYCGYALFTEPGGLPGAEYAAWLLEWAEVQPGGLVALF